MAGDQDAGSTPEPGVDERSTERRIAASIATNADHDEPHPIDFAHDHDAAFAARVARGSTFARDGDDIAAMDELERAMALDPREPKVKDLLALVYFRLGHYANAILLYEELRAQFPRDIAAKLNLALASMKAGDVEGSRAELEELVRANPSHRRAWGYLGMAYDWLGESELALRAFDRGRLPDMAARVGRRGDRLTVPAPSGAAESPSSEHVSIASVSLGAQQGFFEVDGGVLTPEHAQPPLNAQAHEHGEGTFAPPLPPPSLVLSEPPASLAATFDPAGLTKDHTTTAPPPGSPPLPVVAAAMRDESSAAPRAALTRTLGAQTPITAKTRAAAPRAPFARSRILPFPEPRGVTRDASGLVLVTVQGGVADGEGFAARLESLRAYTASLRTHVLERQIKGRAMPEPFGGFGAPLVRFDGAGELVLAARSGQTLLALELDGERGLFREELVVGFELRLDHESVRAPLDEGEGATMVQLRGGGGVVLESAHEIRALEVTTGRGACVRREVVAGWVGSITTRPLAARDAPLGQSGLCLVEGDGVLFVLAR